MAMLIHAQPSGQDYNFGEGAMTSGKGVAIRGVTARSAKRKRTAHCAARSANEFVASPGIVYAARPLREASFGNMAKER
jgi:hypothetical protein